MALALPIIPRRRYTGRLLQLSLWAAAPSLRRLYVLWAYWSRYQAARCDWLQQNCLMNILVLAQNI